MIGVRRFKALPIDTGLGSVKERQPNVLPLRDRLTAKPGGAEGGGRSPFILTVDWLGWVCYLPDKPKFN